jgi:hypothetical protein
MGEVLRFRRRDKGFDTEATAVLVRAYERAAAAIEQGAQPQSMYEVAARRIIAMASKGERNADRLCAAALATVTKSAAKSMTKAAAKSAANAATKSARRRLEPPARLAPNLILIDTRPDNAGDGRR